MIVDRVSQAAEEVAPEPERSCRRQVLPVKAETKKAGNLRRIRMEIRKMRSVAKGRRTLRDSSDSSDSDDCPNKRRNRCLDNAEDDLMAYDVAKHEVGSDRRPVVSTHGKISVIGRRREMEDAMAVELDFIRRGRKSYDLYGVYGGHGGWRVAEKCSEMMDKVLMNILGDQLEDGGDQVINWNKLMVEGFRKMDEEVNEKGAAVETMLSKAVVAVVGEEEVVVANYGDSRAVLCRSGATVPSSDDYKPDGADGLERVEDSGGKVIGQRVSGVLASSKSIGDEYVKPLIRIEPEVNVLKRTDSDEFLILASNGLWDVVSNDLACQVTRRCLDGVQIRRSSFSGDDRPADVATNNASKAAAVLAELAMARGSRHNISVIVVELKRSPSGQGAAAAASSCSCR